MYFGGPCPIISDQEFSDTIAVGGITTEAWGQEQADDGESAKIKLMRVLCGSLASAIRIQRKVLLCTTPSTAMDASSALLPAVSAVL